jgi:purine-nucleoside phosphorylase
MHYNATLVERAVRFLAPRLTESPRLAIVLGSGLQTDIEGFHIEREIPYSKIPGFATSSVSGHENQLRIGTLSNLRVVLLRGRIHYYEGHSMEAVTFPVRVLARWGISALLLTNAAGGIRPGLEPGAWMCIEDHINFMGANPLRGMDATLGKPFVDLTEVYDPGLRELLFRAAKTRGISLHRGVYLAVSGPSYETPAEIRAFHKIGADVVGMSTVPEAIVARQCGMHVAGLSCVTNLAAGRGKRPISHEEVLEIGRVASREVARLLAEFCRRLSNTKTPGQKTH